MFGNNLSQSFSMRNKPLCVCASLCLCAMCLLCTCIYVCVHNIFVSFVCLSSHAVCVQISQSQSVCVCVCVCVGPSVLCRVWSCLPGLCLPLRVLGSRRQTCSTTPPQMHCPLSPLFISETHMPVVIGRGNLKPS